jgi:CubicO group peptidase (beta-lactamase class C family)
LAENENTSSASYFPEYNITDTAIHKIKNKHFLSMSSGLDWKGGVDATDVIAMSQSDDWAKYVFERNVINEPGEHYNYNSGGTQVISSILHRQVGYDLEKFAVDSLFSPLGIESYFWDKTLNGVPKAGWGLHLKMADMAKLGYLMLRNGIWEERQLIPKYWVAKSTTSKIKISDSWDYGYQFWIPREPEYQRYFFRGYYPPSHKIIEVIPELDMVAVYVGENSDFREVIKTHIEILEEEYTMR